jgi:hypothetical protein
MDFLIHKTFGSCSFFSGDPRQQFFRRLVGGILGDEFAGEGAGEEGRRQLFHLPARLRQPQL